MAPYARRLFFAQALVVLLLGALHVSALTFDLYWHYVWLDTLSHFLGGLWVGLLAMWGGEHFFRRKLSVLWGIFAIACVGVGWEVFEVVAGIPREGNFVLDTSIDLTMDLLGLLSAFIARKYIWIV